MKLSLEDLTLQNLDEFSAKLWHACDQLELMGANLWLQIFQAEREIKETEAKVWMRWSQKLVGGKTPTQKFMDYQVEMDPQVQAAHLRYAKLEHQKRKIEGKLRVLRMIDRSLPGRQGERNKVLDR